MAEELPPEPVYECGDRVEVYFDEGWLPAMVLDGAYYAYMDPPIWMYILLMDQPVASDPDMRRYQEYRLTHLRKL